ncbi:hypothetical protein COOONC_20488, partial [Cooperia oncophora]
MPVDHVFFINNLHAGLWQASPITGSGDSNFSHREEDVDLEAGNRETLRRDAERQAALQLERAK